MNREGLFLVVSAPSGAGKHSILERVLAQDDGIEYAVSATTRKPRDGEVDGVDYHFFDEDGFKRRVEAGEFLEWAEVHGKHYGTLRSELERRRASGKDVVVQIDVQGMRNLKQAGEDIVSIFIVPPSIEELERRLRNRKTDSPEQLALRLATAREEMKLKDDYDHIVVNDDLDTAVADFEAIVREERSRRGRQT